MTKVTYTEQQLARISELQQKHNLSRKNATARLQRELKAQAKVAAPEQQYDDATKGVMAEGKAAAAPKAEKTAPAKAEKAPKAEVVRLTPEQVSANRKEGLRLFALSGRPSKEAFIAIFGKEGHKWTWIQRAKALNYASAEAVAVDFPRLLSIKAPQLVKAAAAAPTVTNPATGKVKAAVVPTVISKPNGSVATGKAAVSQNPIQRKASSARKQAQG